MNLRYILWGVAAVGVLWTFVDFIHNLIEAADPKTDYPSNYDAVSYLITGLINQFQWIFYAEIYHLIKKLFNKNTD